MCADNYANKVNDWKPQNQWEWLYQICNFLRQTLNNLGSLFHLNHDVNCISGRRDCPFKPLPLSPSKKRNPRAVRDGDPYSPTIADNRARAQASAGHRGGLQCPMPSAGGHFAKTHPIRAEWWFGPLESPPSLRRGRRETPAFISRRRVHEDSLWRNIQLITLEHRAQQAGRLQGPRPIVKQKTPAKISSRHKNRRLSEREARSLFWARAGRMKEERGREEWSGRGYAHTAA